MLMSHVFHVNAVEKLPRIQEQINAFLGTLADDAIVSVSSTELGPSAGTEWYSYTVLVVYKK